MNELLFIFPFITLWTYNYLQIKKFIQNFWKKKSNIPHTYFFTISLGFIASFIILSSINIASHLLGFTLSNIFYLLVINIIFLKFNLGLIKEFLKNLNYLKSNFIDLFNKINFKNPFVLFLIFIIIIQGICLFLRFLLPVTHGDQLNQYFFDSLQISRLNNLSINDYYEIGGKFRSDSLASFFDAIILQFTNNWTLVRSFKVISLLLVIFSSLEIFYNLGNFTFKKGLLLVCIITTLPDVWDTSLSGKHDGYLMLFEIIGIYSITLSILFSERILKYIFSLTAIVIGLVSTGIRLSSLSFLSISILLLIYYLFRYPLKLNKENIKTAFSIKNLKKFLIIVGILSPTLFMYLINYKFLSNPFYQISPPGFFADFFPDAKYRLQYDSIKSAYSLNNIPIIFKSIFTFLYAVLGLEPIRYGFTKIQENSSIINNLSNFLNYIGPKDMMVSMLSLSPFSLIPFIKIRNIGENKKQFLFIFIAGWVALWTLSVPYTRVAIASSLSLIIIGFSIPYKDLNKKYSAINKSIYYLLFTYGSISIFLFSLWSFSNLYDLPVKSLLNSNLYSRTSLTRDYMKRINNLYYQDNEIPSIKFEKDWKKIEEKNQNKLLILKKAPAFTAYFMTKGLVFNSEKINKYDKKNSLICFKVDDEFTIENIEC